MTNEIQPKQEISRSEKVRQFFRKIMRWFSFLLIVGIALAYFICNYTYSEGNRAGLLLKFAKKGFVFKTYEGEINMGGINPIPGNTIANNIWEFSVRDEVVAQHLLQLEGKMVKLHYKEHIRRMPWQGETNFFVDDVEEVQSK